MNYLKIILFVFTISILFSCNDDDASSIPTGSISGHVMHHDDAIPSAIVYIKFGATEFPGANPEDYDDQVTTSDSDAHYEFSGLAKGSYYLYSVGMDPGCACEVLGGIPVELDSDSHALETNIPVTE